MYRLAPQHFCRLAWPGAFVLLGLLALLHPAGGPAGVALFALVALLGAGTVTLGVRGLPRLTLPGLAPDIGTILVMVTASALLFGHSWNAAGYRIYDWGPHHATLAHLVEGLRDGHVPAWVQGVSTGESPFELYAFLPYYLAAKAAILADITDLTLVMVRSAILIHSLAALGAALLACRVVRWPLGIVVGLATLIDLGSVWGGGIEGLFAMGVTHSALSHGLWSFVLTAVIGALRQPRLWRSVLIWALVALAAACHPLGIVSALATIGALLLVALLGRDVPPYRALVAALHVVIGLLLVAGVWMPFGQRVLLYGVHYGIAPKLAWEQVAHMLGQPVPEATLAPLVYAGYIGVVVAIISRRAVPTLVAAFASIIMAGLFDQLYTVLDLIPSVETARFQMVRLPAGAKGSLYVAAAYLLDLALSRSLTPRAPGRSAAVGAVLALGVFGVARGGLPYLDKLTADIRWLAAREVPDSEGLEALISWARQQNEGLRPEQYGRLLDEDERRTFLVYHVHAKSGLPVVWLGSAVPVFFLRERMVDASPSSLRRFNVRWVMRADRAPSLGDPATEQRFGRYVVRELPEWDGRFARVESGAGDAVVTQLADERVEVELSGTAEPSLVALGMGYYPRWQATHAERGALPVYALPATPGAQTHVLAAWLPPGKTTFRPSGALPSDGKGRGLALLASACAVFIVAVWWRLPRVRLRLSRWTARGLLWVQRHRRVIATSALGLLALGLSLASIVMSGLPARTLQVGSGLWPGARVDLRAEGGAWKPCSYSPLRGGFRCPGKILISDTLTGLLNDAPPSLSFNVPAIHVPASTPGLELRVRMKAHLAGEYWAGTNGGRARLAIDDEPEISLSDEQSSHLFDATTSGPRDVTLTAPVPTKRPLLITFVQRARLDPDRGYVAPPAQSPW